ncbi:unnamed protein product, partial [Cuscuta campestris]
SILMTRTHVFGQPGFTFENPILENL